MLFLPGEVGSAVPAFFPVFFPAAFFTTTLAPSIAVSLLFFLPVDLAVASGASGLLTTLMVVTIRAFPPGYCQFGNGSDILIGGQYGNNPARQLLDVLEVFALIAVT